MNLISRLLHQGEESTDKVNGNKTLTLVTDHDAAITRKSFGISKQNLIFNTEKVLQLSQSEITIFIYQYLVVIIVRWTYLYSG